jgi:invasion protein IalB
MIGIRYVVMALAVLSPAQGMAQAAPSATTATYGAWTVTCAAAEAAKVCQMTTKLSVKGNDGQVRPLIEVAVGQPVGGDGVRIVVQVPMDVALREAVMISVDAPGAADQTPKPQTELAQASYFACVPAGCIADAGLTAETIAALQAASTTNVTFTALAGAKKITVPVPMTGFGDAWAALGVPGQ